MLFVDAGNTVCDVQHSHAPGKHFVSQERIPLTLALLIVQLEHGDEDVPVSFKLDLQVRIVLTLLGIELALIGFQRGIHFRANFFECGAVRFSTFKIRLQQVISNISSGNVKIGPNIVQNMIAEKKLLPDLITVSADLPQHAQSIDSSQSDDGEETAKTNDQRNTGAQYEAVELGVEAHVLCMVELLHEPRLT